MLAQLFYAARWLAYTLGAEPPRIPGRQQPAAVHYFTHKNRARGAGTPGRTSHQGD